MHTLLWECPLSSWYMNIMICFTADCHKTNNVTTLIYSIWRNCRWQSISVNLDKMIHYKDVGETSFIYDSGGKVFWVWISLYSRYSMKLFISLTKDLFILVCPNSPSAVSDLSSSVCFLVLVNLLLHVTPPFV